MNPGCPPAQQEQAYNVTSIPHAHLNQSLPYLLVPYDKIVAYLKMTLMCSGSCNAIFGMGCWWWPGRGQLVYLASYEICPGSKYALNGFSDKSLYTRNETTSGLDYPVYPNVAVKDRTSSRLLNNAGLVFGNLFDTIQRF
jgi:hypothetical protein